MDAEHSRVKVTYEKPAEELGLVDKQSIDFNSAAEDFTDDKDEVRKRIELGKHRYNKLNFTHMMSDKSGHVRHQKRHIGKRREEIKKLKKVLEGRSNYYK